MSSTDIDPKEGTWDLENKKFARNSAGKVVVRTADDDLLTAVQALSSSGPLAGLQWDAYDITYNALTDVVEYYQGGLGGTLLITFTQTYATTRKKRVVSGVWTTP